ncbi:MAG TPA: copper resistance protein B [Allosphingosinicella sp.]|nr:copper resistance protein B [Allosphingosinicella sp.]
MRSAFALLVLLAPAPAAAQRLGYEDVLTPGPAPRLAYRPMAIAEPPPAPAADAAAAEPEPFAEFYGDRIEIVPEGNSYAWDVSAQIGNGPHRLWLASTGSGLFHGGVDYVGAQALYSHPILDAGLALQAGVQRDFLRPRRTYAVVGMQGNVTAPLYIGAFGYLSTKGEVTGSAYAYYDWEPVRNVVLQPYAGVDFAAADIPALGLGRGATALELSARLRYRVAEPFAPYVGISYGRLLGRTARLARLAGEDPESTSLLLGIRSYF